MKLNRNSLRAYSLVTHILLLAAVFGGVVIYYGSLSNVRYAAESMYYQAKTFVVKSLR